MDFKEYHERATKTKQFPPVYLKRNKTKTNSPQVVTFYDELGFVYPALGLAGESGEVVEVLKKILRNNNGVPTAEFVEKLKYELGDVLWYLDILCSEFGFTLEQVAELNVKKLESRVKRDKIKSEGDFR